MTVSPATLGDLKALLRWFRSTGGPLYQEWESGSLTFDEDDFGMPFRRLLKLLDGSDHDVRRIDIFAGATGEQQVRAMFRMYRRLRRCVARENDAAIQAWLGGTTG